MMQTLHTYRNLSSASSVKTNRRSNRRCRNLSLSSVNRNHKYRSLTKNLNLSSASRESNLASRQSKFSVNTKKTPVNRIFEYTISTSYNWRPAGWVTQLYRLGRAIHLRLPAIATLGIEVID